MTRITRLAAVVIFGAVLAFGTDALFATPTSPEDSYEQCSYYSQGTCGNELFNQSRGN